MRYARSRGGKTGKIFLTRVENIKYFIPVQLNQNIRASTPVQGVQNLHQEPMDLEQFAVENFNNADNSHERDTSYNSVDKSFSNKRISKADSKKQYKIRSRLKKKFNSLLSSGPYLPAAVTVMEKGTRHFYHIRNNFKTPNHKDIVDASLFVKLKSITSDAQYNQLRKLPVLAPLSALKRRKDEIMSQYFPNLVPIPNGVRCPIGDILRYKLSTSAEKICKGSDIEIRISGNFLDFSLLHTAKNAQYNVFN